MAWVYILHNALTNRYYIGSTVDLKRRLRQHRSGNTRTTRVLGTKDLVYTEEYPSVKEARLREKQIKSYKSRIYIEKLILQEGEDPDTSVSDTGDAGQTQEGEAEVNETLGGNIITGDGGDSGDPINAK